MATQLFDQLLRRISVRVRIVGGFILIMLIVGSISPIILSNFNSLVTRLEQFTNVDTKIERLLLLASRRVAVSQLNLNRYSQDNVPSPYEALDDVDQAIQGLNEAQAMVTDPEQVETIALVIQSLKDYQQQITDLQKARTAGNNSETTRLYSKLQKLGNDIGIRLELMVNSNVKQVAATNDQVLNDAKQSINIGFLVMAIGLILAITLSILISASIARPLAELRTGTEAFQKGDMVTVINARGSDEFTVIARTFNNLVKQIRELISGLEQRVAERTKALSYVAEVGTAASTIFESDELLQQVVDLSKERFNFYHAHIYLLDAAGENLMLAAGAGEPGRQMMSEGRSIPFDREQSLVARAARERKGITVNDVTLEPDFLPNPLLPDTRSELAVPMIAGGNVLGVIDVQSDITGRFTEADINIQTTLASQIAIALQNARSFTQAEQQRRQNELILDTAGEGIFGLDVRGNHTFVNPAAAEMLGYSIEELIGKHSHTTWHHTHADGTPFPGEECPIYFTVNKGIRNQGEEYFIRKDGTGFHVSFSSVPIQEEDRTVGAVVTFTNITQQKHEREFAAQRAKQQEALNLITQRIQNTTSVEAALQMAARELGHAMGAQTVVHLDTSDGQKGTAVIGE